MGSKRLLSVIYYGSSCGTEYASFPVHPLVFRFCYFDCFKNSLVDAFCFITTKMRVRCVTTILVCIVLCTSDALYMNTLDMPRGVADYENIEVEDVEPPIISDEIPELPGESLMELSSVSTQLASTRTKDLQTAYDDVTEDVKFSLHEILRYTSTLALALVISPS